MEHPERRNHPTPSRREFVALGIGAFAVAMMPIGLRRRPTLVRRSVPVMGTIADFALVHTDQRYAQTAIDAAVAELRFVDRTMTRFSHTSDIGRANLGGTDNPVPITEETAFVLEHALDWAVASEGAFDPCLGRAVELWDVGRRTEPPAAQRVRALAGRSLYRALDLDRRGGEPVVRLAGPEAAIDLGGIAKGYGVDRAVEALRAFGITSAVVNVGGDLYAMGTSQDGDRWKVGIRSPDQPDELIGTIDVEDRAVATSGDYLQYFQHGGRRYHHMLDPETGEPRRSPMRSVTVAANDCMTADAAGTAVFGMPAARAGTLLRSRGAGIDVVHTA